MAKLRDEFLGKIGFLMKKVDTQGNEIGQYRVEGIERRVEGIERRVVKES